MGQRLGVGVEGRCGAGGFWAHFRSKWGLVSPLRAVESQRALCVLHSQHSGRQQRCRRPGRASGACLSLVTASASPRPPDRSASGRVPAALQAGPAPQWHYCHQGQHGPGGRHPGRRGQQRVPRPGRGAQDRPQRFYTANHPFPCISLSVLSGHLIQDVSEWHS